MTTTLFMGTADLARTILQALLAQTSLRVPAVVTQPDRPRGRQLKLVPSAVKVLALEHGLTVLQPGKARDPKFIEELRAWQPELIVVAAYGQILPQGILDLPRFGCLNVHASLLPKYRGAAPIQWALLNGDSSTGVTLMKMNAGMDTGDMLRWRGIPIDPADTGQSLQEKLARLGAELLVEVIPDYLSGRIQPVPQDDSQATYARKITKEDGIIRWDQPALNIWRQIRAFTPWPGASTFALLDSEKRLLKIWEAAVVDHPGGPPGQVLQANREGILVACGQQALRLLILQREGKRPLPAATFLAGSPLQPGTLLGPAK